MAVGLARLGAAMTRATKVTARYLRQRRGRCLVQVAVPVDLRAHFGRANIERYLQTSDRREAERRAIMRGS